MHRIPLKVYNTLPKNYEIVDMIISSRENNDLRISYEQTTKKIPSLAKDRTVGYLQMFPSDLDKVSEILISKKLL